MPIIEIGSPQWLENHLRNLELKISQGASRHAWIARILSLIAWIAVAHWLLFSNNAFWLTQHNPQGAWLLITQGRPLLILWLAAILSPYVKIPSLLLFFAIVASQIFRFSIDEAPYFLAFLFLSVLVPAWLYSKTRPAQGKYSLLIGCIYTVVTFIVIHAFYKEHPTSIIFRVERVFMIFCFAILSLQTQPKNDWRSWFKISDLIYPLAQLQSAKGRPSPLSELRAIPAIGAIFLAAYIAPDPYGNFFAVSFRSYLYYFLNSWGAVVCIVAIAKALGWTEVTAFEYPLLATSPAACWARWNIPFYQWLKLVVFNPVYRRFRNLGLSVLVTFFVSYLLHDSQEWVDYWHTSNPESFSLLKYKLYFFFSHGLAVWLSLSFSRWIPSSNRRISWLAVTATWLVMSIIHWWVRWT